MVIKVAVEMAGQGKGVVSYNTKSKVIEVDYPSESIRQSILSYLMTKREFQIPESQQLDDYRIDKAYPSDNITYFQLAMCTLWANTGVLVDWSTEKQMEE